ncbi:MAG: octanoyltransferase [Longimicrobiales bacterium]
MAIDEALLHGVQNGAPPVLRFYQWTPACLSFGRNQTARDIFDPAISRLHGIDVVRRPTGGLAVLHNRELTYSVAAPAALLGGPRQAYRAINRALLAGLATLGVDAILAGRDAAPTRPTSLQPCFQAPGEGEVVAGGGKLVGSAQCCERRTILQHGSILLDGDQRSLVAYQMTPVMAEGGGTTLRSVLGTLPDVQTIVAALAAGFVSVLGTRLATSGLTGSERTEAARLEERYDSDAWTWRR